ncbi:hypothetical protein C5167_031961, partial [Papaver somniferum]
GFHLPSWRKTDSTQDDICGSPRLIELQDKKKQLWRAQNKSKQKEITEQAFNEKRRIAYQNRKTRMDEAVSNLRGAHKAESTLIPRRSPRFIGCENISESLDQCNFFGDETCRKNNWHMNERGTVFEKEPVG